MKRIRAQVMVEESMTPLEINRGLVLAARNREWIARAKNLDSPAIAFTKKEVKEYLELIHILKGRLNV